MQFNKKLNLREVFSYAGKWSFIRGGDGNSFNCGRGLFCVQMCMTELSNYLVKVSLISGGDSINDRIMAVVVNVLGQRKLLLRNPRGIVHVFIFWGFMLLGLTVPTFYLTAFGICISFHKRTFIGTISQWIHLSFS